MSCRYMRIAHFGGETGRKTHLGYNWSDEAGKARKMALSAFYAKGDRRGHLHNPVIAGHWRFFRHFHFPARSQSDEADESGQDNRTDSIWAVVAGFVKTFGVPFDYVLYELSYANLVLYDRVLPTYISKRDKKKGGKKLTCGTMDSPIRADDPRNKDLVRAIIKGYK